MYDKPNDNESKRDTKKEAELRRSTRRQRAVERLDTPNPRCVRCPENDPIALERHHVAGQAFDASTIILCRNCHRKLSDLQNDHPSKIANPPDPLEVIAHFLLGLADLFEFLVAKFREFAKQLLDSADPNRDNIEPTTP